MMKFIGIIPARYASTRFPGKPLADMNGKPMIQRVYEQVKDVLDSVCVATDDIRIENAVKAFGGQVVMTKNNEAMYFSRSIIPYIRGKKYTEWLPSHTFYKHIGLYAYRAQVLKEITQLPQSALELAESLEQLRWLENGYKIKVGITEQETIGIDTPEDMEKALAFLANR